MSIGASARRRCKRLTRCDHVAKDSKRSPAAPFTTSTLQQDASQRLGFGGVRTMSLAQELYEGRAVEGGTAGPDDKALVTHLRVQAMHIILVYSAKTALSGNKPCIRRGGVCAARLEVKIAARRAQAMA